MKKIFILAAMLMAMSAVGFGQGTPAPASSPKPAPTPVPYDKLKVGDMAPDFSLSDTAGNKVKLSDFRGKSNVVLAFFVLAFTGG